jgi:RecA-family ATPase
MSNGVQNSVIALSEESIARCLQQNSKEQILKGLFRGSVGFLIASPDSGKSYLCLSIAYELALPDCELIGLTGDPQKPFRTLLWPIEDSIMGTLPRITEHLAGFSASAKEQLKTNVGIYSKSDAICCSGVMRNTVEWDNSVMALNRLIETAKDYDLIVVDTLRDATGSADEVKDDYFIRVALNRLAEEADVAVLVVHHPTKEVSRGKVVINSVAGSGLSSTLSKSKLHLYLDQVTDKEGAIVQTRLRHVKANFLPFDQQWRKPITLVWSENSLLYCNESAFERISTGVSTKKIIKKVESVSRRRSRLPEEPITIDRDESLISDESRRLAEKVEQGPFGQGMMSELQVLKRGGS